MRSTMGTDRGDVMVAWALAIEPTRPVEIATVTLQLVDERTG